MLPNTVAAEVLDRPPLDLCRLNLRKESTQTLHGYDGLQINFIAKFLARELKFSILVDLAFVPLAFIEVSFEAATAATKQRSCSLTPIAKIKRRPTSQMLFEIAPPIFWI